MPVNHAGKRRAVCPERPGGMKRAMVFLALLALILCGCERNTAREAPEGAISKSKIYLTAMQYELDGQNIDFNSMWFFTKLEERTNVHVDFIEVKGAEWDTRLALMFASGNYYDMILRGDIDVEQYGVAQKLLVPLDEYIEDCMPNYHSRLRLNGAGDTIPASDGKSYYVGYLASEDINVDGHFFINKAWLDALGLSVPRTVDELTRALAAFRDNDLNGNGVKDEVPYLATLNDNSSGLYNTFAFWGVPMNEEFVYLDDAHTVRFAPAEDGYRECVIWLNSLYKQGLIDPESLTQAQSLFNVKLNTNTAGFFSYRQLENTQISPEIASQFVCILPVSAEGYSARVCKTLEVAQLGAALTIANQHVRESLMWLDAQLETETMLVSQNGKLGDALTINAEGRYEAAYVPADSALYAIVPGACGQFFAPADYYAGVYDAAPHRLEKAGYCRDYESAGVLEGESYYALTRLSRFTGAEASRLSQLKPAIQSAVNEALVNMVFSGADDYAWAAFVAMFQSLGVYEYASIYQAAYDRGRYAEANQ